MLYIYDKKGKEIGFINYKYGMFHCFNSDGLRIGKLLETPENIYLFNKNGKIIAKYDGQATYDRYCNFINDGNILYQMLYPTLAEIR